MTVMLLSYALEHRAVAWVFIFAAACAASSLYGWLAGTWPFGVVEGVWALVAVRRGVMAALVAAAHGTVVVLAAMALVPARRSPVRGKPAPLQGVG